MEAIAIGDGRIDVRSTLLRSTSSLFTIASGGSIGREGSMVQLAATFASLAGRARHLSAESLRLVVACGAAAGITAAYNAPIAAAFFVSEIILGSISMASFSPLIVAAVAANVTMREFAGYRPPYEMPAFPEINVLTIPLFALLGLLSGVLAPGFLGLLAWSRGAMNRLAWPLPLRLALGGLVVGAISIAVPEVWGNGYSVVNDMLHNPWLAPAVLGVLVAKVVATAATAGSGAIGGVFTPTLFVGAASGYLFGAVVLAVWPGAGTPSFAFAMVGMGAFLSAATLAPLMAILLVFEMTLSYPVMLPLSLATVLAAFVARAWQGAPMYAVIARREADQRQRAALRGQTMGDLVRPAETTLLTTASLADVAELMARVPVKFVYLLDSDGAFAGAVALTSLAQCMVQGSDLAGQRAIDHCAPDFPTLSPDTGLKDALDRFIAFPAERMPVVESSPKGRLLGVVYKSALLDAYARLSQPESIVP
jgi:CIC family chloride channel protein